MLIIFILYSTKLHVPLINFQWSTDGFLLVIVVPSHQSGFNLI